MTYFDILTINKEGSIATGILLTPNPPLSLLPVGIKWSLLHEQEEKVCIGPGLGELSFPVGRVGQKTASQSVGIFFFFLILFFIN